MQIIIMIRRFLLLLCLWRKAMIMIYGFTSVRISSYASTKNVHYWNPIRFGSDNRMNSSNSNSNNSRRRRGGFVSVLKDEQGVENMFDVPSQSPLFEDVSTTGTSEERQLEEDVSFVFTSSSPSLVDLSDLSNDDDDDLNDYDLFEIDEDDSDEDEDMEWTFMDEDEEDDDDDGDVVIYMRDDDDMLTEREDRLYLTQAKVETCILVGCEDLSYKRSSATQKHDWEARHFNLDESLVEMRELIKTAGMTCIGEVTQRLNNPNPRTYVGTGKVKTIQDMASKMGCGTVVFDAELTPGQQKQLENAFNKKILQNDFLGSEQEREIKVIDRTALILDIFAQHAKTREGKLQVELALNIYRKPRLTRMWTHLERQSGAGGVGLRGPGESQLEIDKRLVRDRIITLKRAIDGVQKQRQIHRRGRDNLGLPVIALIGYTNAGKSTLLNYLTRAGVLAESILFATLDPTTRRVKLPGLKTHPEVLLTDTVGFIQALPTQLVAAFRATLEEVKEADVLVHVMDVSNPVWSKQEIAVLQVLEEMDIGDKPIIRLWNKIDTPGLAAEDLKYEAAGEELSVAISSITGDGMEDFVAVMEEALSSLLEPIECIIPYSKGLEMNMIHEVGAVEIVDYREEGTYVIARVPKALAMRLEPYYIKDDLDNTSQIIETDSSDDNEIDWTTIGRGRHPKFSYQDEEDTD